MFKWLKRLFKKDNNNSKKNKKDNINEWSYQRFASFYDEKVLLDPLFNDKIKSIIDCVNNKRMDSIDEIAKVSNCTFDECVMKLRYLKNKRVIGNYYLDKINRTVRKCTEQDDEILKKYYNMIYVNHYQISEMAKQLPNYHNKPLTIIEEDVYKDIKYLYDKSIVNGIKLIPSTKEIKYYTIEKHKKEEYCVTINCPKCGALVDVEKGKSVRCDYCNSLVEDKE